MLQKIFKYTLELTDVQALHLPSESKILHVDVQNENICLWALVYENWPVESRMIRIVGTGHPVDTADLIHLGTVQQGPYVWHVFEQKN